MRHVLITTEGKKLQEGSKERELENEKMVLGLLMHKVQPLRIECEGKLVYFIFDAIETNDAMMKLLSNGDDAVQVRDVFYAMETWKNALTLAKAILKEFRDK